MASAHNISLTPALSFFLLCALYHSLQSPLSLTPNHTLFLSRHSPFSVISRPFFPHANPLSLSRHTPFSVTPRAFIYHATPLSLLRHALSFTHALPSFSHMPRFFFPHTRNASFSSSLFFYALVSDFFLIFRKNRMKGKNKHRHIRIEQFFLSRILIARALPLSVTSRPPPYLWYATPSALSVSQHALFLSLVYFFNSVFYDLFSVLF